MNNFFLHTKLLKHGKMNVTISVQQHNKLYSATANHTNFTCIRQSAVIQQCAHNKYTVDPLNRSPNVSPYSPAPVFIHA